MLGPYATTDILQAAAVGLAAGVLTFYLRAHPRWGRRHWGVDMWFHLKIADVMRGQRRVPREVDGFLLGGTYDYPPGLPRMLSWLPRGFVERHRCAVSPLSEALHGTVIVIFSTWFWHDLRAGAAALAVYVLTPITVFEGAELRPRSIGAMFVSVALASAAVFDWSGDWPWAACAVAAAAATMLFHRMSTQFLVVTLCALSALTLTLSYVGILLGGIVLAIGISGGVYLRVLRGHISELRFWHANIHSRDDDDPMKLILGARRERSTKASSRGLVRSVYGLIRRHPYVAAVPIAYFSRWQGSMPQGFLLLWVAIAYMAFILTSYLTPLRFLGQGYRYLAFAALPVAVFASGYAVNIGDARLMAHLTMALLTFIAVRETVALYRWLMANHHGEMTEDLWSMMDWLKAAPRDGVICLPFALAGAASYFSGKRVLRHYSSRSMHPITTYYPLVKRPLPELAGEFGAAYIRLDVRSTRGTAPEMPDATEVRRAGPYRIYEVAAAPSGPPVAREAVTGPAPGPGDLTWGRTGGEVG